MNAWNFAACGLLLTMIPCLWACLTGTNMERLLGLQLGQIIGVLILVALSEGYGRDIYLDAALVLAVLSLASALVFIRFLERWL